MENKIYYIYRHVRLDKNQVFYIGKGTRNKVTKKGGYARAFDTNCRNRFWKIIYNKSGENILVEILYETENKHEINLKEIEFISLYGRKDLENGTLCNLTNGGDGGNGLVVSEKNKKMYSTRMTKYMANGGKLMGVENPKAQKILQYNLQGVFIKEWPCMIDASNELGIRFGKISSCVCLDRVKSGGGYIWKYYTENYPLNIEPYFIKNPVFGNEKPILQYSLEGKFIAEYPHRSAAANAVGVNRSYILGALQRTGYCNGYVWIYKKDFTEEKLKETISFIYSKKKIVMHINKLKAKQDKTGKFLLQNNFV